MKICQFQLISEDDSCVKKSERLPLIPRKLKKETWKRGQTLRQYIAGLECIELETAPSQLRSNKHVYFVKKEENAKSVRMVCVKRKNSYFRCLCGEIIKSLEGKPYHCLQYVNNLEGFEYKYVPKRNNFDLFHIPGQERTLITYDIECYSETKHMLYCLSYKVDDGVVHTVTKASAFWDIVFSIIDELNYRVYQEIIDIRKQISCNPQSEMKAELITKLKNLNKVGSFAPRVVYLVSFNGSRYDDIILMKEYRAKIFKLNNGDFYSYAKKAGAVIFNNTMIDRVLLQQVDLTRYTASVTSLRTAANSMRLQTTKGEFPFKVLNDYLTNSVKWDDDGEYFHSSYFKTIDHYKESREEAFLSGLNQVLKENRVQWLCFRYCERDVQVTYELALAIEKMMYTVVSEICSLCLSYPYVERYFSMFRFHSLSQLCATLGALSVELSIRENRIYDSDAAKWVNYSDIESVLPVEDIVHVPTGPAYMLWKSCIFGGWVSPYFQGVIDNGNTGVDNNNVSCDYIVADLISVDIASCYPNVVSGMHGIGKPVHIDSVSTNEESKRLIHALILKVENAKRISECPIFAAEVLIEPPEKMNSWISHLPCRVARNSLSWTYEPASWQAYCSIDLWNATHFGGWKIVDMRNIDVFRFSGQCYAKFVQIMRELKYKGTASGNILMRNAAKIGANSQIGKLVQRAEHYVSLFIDNHSVETMRQFQTFVTSNKSAELIHVTYNSVRNGVTEYLFKSTDASKNNVPLHHGVIMYGLSRSVRLNITLRGRFYLLTGITLPRDNYYFVHPNDMRLIRELPDIRTDTLLPCPANGDTDSFFWVRDAFNGLEASFKGDQVGLFDSESDQFNTQLEIENVYQSPTARHLIGYFIAKKEYMLCSEDYAQNKILVKRKFKGHREWNEDTHPCFDHSRYKCDECRCLHLKNKISPLDRQYKQPTFMCQNSDSNEHEYYFNCIYCCIAMTVTGEAEKVYKDQCIAIQDSVALLHQFMLVTQNTVLKVTYNRLERSLDLPVSDLNAFEIKSITRTIFSRKRPIPHLTKQGLFWYPLAQTPRYQNSLNEHDYATPNRSTPLSAKRPLDDISQDLQIE